MKTTRKNFLICAAAFAWLCCGVVSQAAFAAWLPASYFGGEAKKCAVVVVAPKPKAAAHSCCAAKKTAASTRAMACCKKPSQHAHLQPVSSTESVSHTAASHEGVSRVAPASVPASSHCRCETRRAPLQIPVSTAPQKARDASSDQRKSFASHAAFFAPTFALRCSSAPVRAFARRFERVSKPRSLSSSPPLPGRAPPAFA